MKCPHCDREVSTELTPRQVEVLYLLAQGMCRKEVASAMGVVQSTVKCHVGTILVKLSARNSTHAVAIAIREGWVQLERLGEIESLEER